MQRLFFLLIAFGYFSHSCTAQQVGTTKKRRFPREKNSVTAGLAIPLHNFSNTHFGGLAVQYSISNYRFGLLKKKPLHLFGLTANSGAVYFLGKKEKIVSVNYHYPVYINFHIHGGIIYNPLNKMNFQLTAGPGLSLYNRTTRFTIGTGLEGNYFLNTKIALAAGFSLIKEPISDPLYYGSLRASYAF